MALQKQIASPLTGVTAEYWRVTLIVIAPADGSARIELGGYVNANIRQSGGVYVDRRAYDLGPAQFAALAGAATAGPTLFDSIGQACYQYIKDARRPCSIDAQTGEGVLPDGTRYPPESVFSVAGLPTAPSEFADAVDA